MEDGSPTLSVGFEIDFGDSFGGLKTLDDLIGKTAADGVRSFQQLQQSIAGGLSLGDAAAKFKAFGSEADRAGETARQASNKAEKAAESMIRTLERQIATFGKTTAEIRQMDAATKAAAASEQGLTEVAGRLTAVSAEYGRLQASVVGSADAVGNHSAALGLNRTQMIIAQSAVMRFTDSIIAGQSPIRAFALEAHKLGEVISFDDGGVAGGMSKLKSLITPTSLAIAGIAVVSAVATAAALSYGQSLAKLSAIAQGTGALLGLSGTQLEASAEAAARAGNMTVGAARDIEAGYLSIAKSGDVLVGLTVVTKDFAAATGQDVASAQKELGAAFDDPIQGAQTLAEKYGLLSQAQADHIAQLVQEGQQEKAQKELLDDISKAFGGASEKAEGLAASWEHIKNNADQAWVSAGRFFNTYGKGILNGVADALMLPNVDDFAAHDGGPSGGRLVNPAAKRAQAAAANATASFQGDNRDSLQRTMGTLQAGINAGGAADQIKEWTDALNANKRAYDTWTPAAQKANDVSAAEATLAKARTPAAKSAAAAALVVAKNEGVVITQSDLMAQAHSRAAAAAASASRASENHAATLAREAAAQEAQIRNSYALADAYGASGGAALIAEARVKAESKALKDRGDIAAAVSREVQLEIAQRVAASEKNSAATRNQAEIQTEVNALVASGNIPAERAAELVQQRIAELPILQAIEAAQQLKLKGAVDKSTKALEDQRAAQVAAKAAAIGSWFVQSDAAADRQLADLHTELQLVGATEEARARTLATVKATRELDAMQVAPGPYRDTTIAKQVDIAVGAVKLKQGQDAYNASLTLTADKWDIIAGKVQSAGQGMADAFGTAGKAIGDVASTYASYMATQSRLEAVHNAAIVKAGTNQQLLAQENQKFALQSAGSQVAAYGDMLGAAKGFFKEGTAGYEALAAAEKVYRVAQFAMSVAAMVQQVRETVTGVASSAARSTANAAEGVSAQAKLPFPFNLVAMAATAAALVAAGIAVLGGGGSASSHVDLGNTGTGTVLGDTSKGSDSIRNGIDALKNVDTLMLTSSRAMQESLKSIDSQIGSFAAEIVKGGDINANANITTGFQTSGLGSVLSKIPLIGGILGSLFGTRTDITGSGLVGGAQTIGSIEASGYTAQSYSDVEKTKKFLGIVTGRSYSTQTAALDPSLNNQFTLILKSFDSAIAAAAGPLGDATDAVQAKLDGFVVDVGKIDLQGLSGDDIQKKLENVFGALGDQMASYVFPEITAFQKVGEGALETLVRVASTVESVTAGLDELGFAAKAAGIGAKIGIAAQFDSLSDLTSATDAYFQAYYTSAEQAAAKTAQFTKVFDSLGLAMPSTLAGFRQLVEAQDLTTDAGQATYAELLKLAPAFADLASSITGAKSAADIMSERTDLQRQLLELQGDTAAVRALDLAKVDASNQALQQQVWAVQDAQDAAKAAADLADAWKSVGDSILTEINRIRGLNDASGGTSFATLMGQFNAATSAARGGDQDAAKTLPQLSQALLTAAAAAATSRQELDRVQAQTAGSLQATYDAIGVIAATPVTTSSFSDAALLSAAATSQASTTPTAANDDTASAIADLKAELAAMRQDMNAGNATIAGNTGKSAKILDQVTAGSAGQAVAVANAA